MQCVIGKPIEANMFPSPAKPAYKHWELGQSITGIASSANFPTVPGITRNRDVLASFYVSMRSFLLVLQQIRKSDIPILRAHSVTAQANRELTSRSNERDLLGWASISADRTVATVTRLADYYAMRAELRLGQAAIGSVGMTWRSLSEDARPMVRQLGQDLAGQLYGGNVNLDAIFTYSAKKIPEIHAVQVKEVADSLASPALGLTPGDSQ